MCREIAGKTLSLGLVPWVAEEESGGRGRRLPPGGATDAGGEALLHFLLPSVPADGRVPLVGRMRRPSYRELTARSTVDLLTDAQIAAVLGDPDVTEIDINVAGDIHRLSCDKLVAALGFTANLGPLLEWGIEIAGRRHIAVDTKGATSVPGVYAAGDIVDDDGKVRLIATGFGEVATAVNNAAAYLNPSVSAFPGHLSDYAPPGATTSPTA